MKGPFLFKRSGCESKGYFMSAARGDTIAGSAYLPIYQYPNRQRQTGKWATGIFLNDAAPCSSKKDTRRGPSHPLQVFFCSPPPGLLVSSYSAMRAGMADGASSAMARRPICPYMAANFAFSTA